jgi:hypothetical protein
MRVAVPVFAVVLLALSPLRFSESSQVAQRGPAQADFQAFDESVPAPQSGGILGKSKTFGYSVFSCDRENVQIVHCASASRTPEEIRHSCAGPKTLTPKPGFQGVSARKVTPIPAVGCRVARHRLPERIHSEGSEELL